MQDFSFMRDGDKDEFHPRRWASNPGELPKRAPATNVSVLIVGAGVAGLMTALESWRKGHSVVGILESRIAPIYTGDIIIIGPSALRAFSKWPEMRQELEANRDHSAMRYLKNNGELIVGPITLDFDVPESSNSNMTPYAAPHQVRRKLYRMLLRQVARVGLEVEYGQRVETYFDNDETSMGGVVTVTGETRRAHVVVAADACRTASERLIVGQTTPTRSSGMSVYRASVPTSVAMQDPAFKNRYADTISSGTSAHELWLGHQMHLGLYVSPDFVAWGLTPRDSSSDGEGAEPIDSWDATVDPERVLKVLHRLPDWHPAIEGVIRATPKGAIVHWPLLWRNLHCEWTSKGGCVVQVGDAAHSSLPASASGGTLAIEDATTLATCLQLSCVGGAGGVSAGTRVYNILRYERLGCAQKMSFVNAEILGAPDFESMKQNPNKLRRLFPQWLFNHDSEAYALDNYGRAFAHMACGEPFSNSNTPPGHKFQPWTIQEMHSSLREGKGVADILDGDWS